jgi:hypothetical protein
MTKFFFSQKNRNDQLIRMIRLYNNRFRIGWYFCYSQIKTKEKDGINAIQVGLGKKNKTPNALKNHLKD